MGKLLLSTIYYYDNSVLIVGKGNIFKHYLIFTLLSDSQKNNEINYCDRRTKCSTHLDDWDISFVLADQKIY